MRTRSIAVSMLLLVALAARTRADDPPKPGAEDVISEAEGERTVLYIAPEGAHVTQGQVVCVLDADFNSNGLKDRKFTVAQAEASCQQAKRARESAETAVVEYENVTFKRALETAEGEIALAQADLKRSQDRLARSTQLRANGQDIYAQQSADKFDFQKAEFTVEQAMTRKEILLKYTKGKTLKELHAKVVAARTDETARKIERTKAQEIERQAGARVVLAPTDGTVRLARPTGPVKVGARLGKGQLLLSIVPPRRALP